jgi:hypothetical protein
MYQLRLKFLLHNGIEPTLKSKTLNIMSLCIFVSIDASYVWKFILITASSNCWWCGDDGEDLEPGNKTLDWEIHKIH